MSDLSNNNDVKNNENNLSDDTFSSALQTIDNNRGKSIILALIMGIILNALYIILQYAIENNYNGKTLLFTSLFLIGLLRIVPTFFKDIFTWGNRKKAIYILSFIGFSIIMNILVSYNTFFT